MNGWEVGDLALCIDDAPPRDICGTGRLECDPSLIANLRCGALYTVTQVVVCVCGNHLGIGDKSARAGGYDKRFIKVTPPADMALESEGADVPAQVPA